MYSICLNLYNRAHLDKKEFKDINWLPLKKGLHRKCVTAYHFFRGSSSLYVRNFHTLCIFSCPMTRFQLHGTLNISGPSYGTVFHANLSSLNLGIFLNINYFLKTFKLLTKLQLTHHAPCIIMETRQIALFFHPCHIIFRDR